MKHLSKHTKSLAYTAIALSSVMFGTVKAEEAAAVVDRLAKKQESIQTVYHAARIVTEESKSTRKSTVKTWRKRAGKTWKFRQASASEVDAKFESKEKQSEIVTVSDGKDEWREMAVGDKVMVIKSKAQFDPEAELAEIRARLKQGKTKISGPDKVEGFPCTVLEIEGTEGSERFEASYWISEQHGLVLRSKVRRADRLRTEMVTTELKINDELPDSQFAYTPPKDATVVDTDAMAKPQDAPKKP